MSEKEELAAMEKIELAKLNVGIENEWQRREAISDRLKSGIEKGMTWREFCKATSCPDTKNLREKYLSMQRSSGIAPGSHAEDTKNALFLKGFLDKT